AARDLGALHRAGDEDDLQLRMLHPRAGHDVDAVDPWHRDVGDEEIAALLVERRERADRVAEGAHLHTARIAERLGQKLGLLWIVIEDEDGLDPLPHHRAPTPYEASSMPGPARPSHRPAGDLRPTRG